MLLAEIVFLTRILGLAAGEQNIVMQADSEVTRVELLQDGKRVATLHEAPWRTTIDLGLELAPHQLTAIAYDAKGYERGRDTQVLNVAHPPAELGILLERDDEKRVTATVRWAHFAHQDPREVTVKLDGKTVGTGRAKSTFPLGVVDPEEIHALGAEAVFADGIRSRKEIVFGGGYSEQLPAELTPVVVRQRKDTSNAPASCFRSGSGAALPRATIENGSGAALFILNGGRSEQRNLPPRSRYAGLFKITNAEIRIVHPVALRVDHAEGSTRLFDSTAIDGVNGTDRVMMIARPPAGVARFVDAMGSAALRALRGGQRRVIVYVVGHGAVEDHSLNSPASVLGYLKRVGVPLRVWSLTGKRPDLEKLWGMRVYDVTTTAGLLTATEDLRKDLDSQRVAWLPVAPIDTFSVTATADCAYEPLAAELRRSDRDASAR